MTQNQGMEKMALFYLTTADTALFAGFAGPICGLANATERALRAGMLIGTGVGRAALGTSASAAID